MESHFVKGCAVVTGAGSGIGRATAVAFARDGCRKLYLGDISLDGITGIQSALEEEYPDINVKIARLDIADEASVTTFYGDAVKAFGRIDFAANVAGYAHKANKTTLVDTDMYQTCYNVNQRGTFLCERALLRQMLKQDKLDGYQCRGSIVNVTSIASKAVIPLMSVYSASKSGLLAISRTDALDYGPEGIRVNCVAPGNTETPMLKQAMGQAHIDANARVVPLRRNGQPEDIANAIVWLSSPFAGWITGINLPVDGGQSLFTGHAHG